MSDTTTHWDGCWAVKGHEACITALPPESKHIMRTSDRSTFRSCRQKWDFTSKVRLNYEPVRNMHYFEFGSAFHNAMEVFYDPMTWEAPAEDRMDLGVAAFVSTNSKQKKDAAKASGGALPPELSEEYKEREELGVGMLRHYLKYSIDHDKFRPVYAEVEFEVPLIDDDGYPIIIGGLPVVYQGRIDLIVEVFEEYEGITPGYWILDHKTAARMDSIEHVEMDPQIGSYDWAAVDMLNVPMQGFIYSEIRKAYPDKPAVNKVRRQGRILSVNRQQSTSYDLFMQAIEEHNEDPSLYEDHLEWLKAQSSELIRRTVVHRTAAERRYTKEMIIKEAWDMFDNPSIYPNPSKWNCQGCLFRTPCLARHEYNDEDFILENLGLYRSRSD